MPVCAAPAFVEQADDRPAGRLGMRRQRLVGVDRTLRRRGGGAVVSVRLRGRPWPAVLADMIEGRENIALRP